MTAGGTEPWSAPRDPDGRFRNLHPHPRHGLRDLIRWKFGWGPPEPLLVPQAGEEASSPPPVVRPDWERIHRPAADQVTWVGHATFLVQMAGMNVLTDPIWSRSCAPFPSRRLRRLVPPGLGWEELPRIDAVVVSHAHYDHLDGPTVRRLGPEPQYLAPEGLSPLLRRWGARRIAELSWGESCRWGPFRIDCIPAQHFSARSPFDRNRTLWCGWLLESAAGRKLYFAGDTGYGPLFDQFGSRFGPVDAALLPIGAYQPRWFMKPMHVNPPEAVCMHRKIRSRQSFGMHWGTFRLTDEPVGEPGLALAEALGQAGIPAEQFRALAVGETAEF